MAKTASEIVDRALTLIDEVATTFNTAATTETSIREQALEILPEVCRDLVKELPWELKRYLRERASLTFISADDTYYKRVLRFTLPPDFWELVEAINPTWNKAVTEYINIDSSEYSKQNNPFTRGGPQNPVVAITPFNIDSNSRTIEFYSVPGNSISATVFYVSFNNVPNDSGNTWPDELFDEVTKALATEIHIIKSRIDEAAIKGEETVSAIEQHE